MQIEVLTEQELPTFKSELIEEIKQAIKSDVTITQWLLSSAIRKLPKTSTGTLLNLRIKDVLPYENKWNCMGKPRRVLNA